MKDYQREFIDFALVHNVLRFGNFTLKSGRSSPYFFNTGLFNSGAKLAQLGRYYAQAIMDARIEFDMLYGPAYKGIPLACTTAIALAEHDSRDVPYCFNRKELKAHGEGGITVGAPLDGRVLIIDDVISAGTSVNESVRLIEAASARPAGVFLALNRQERGSGQCSAISEIERRHCMKVHSIIALDDLMKHLEQTPGMQHKLQRMREYAERYGELRVS